MEPLKPMDKRRILEESPAAEPADIEEYERLLSERFTVDPDLPTAPPVAEMQSADSRKREARLKELYEKLFRNRGNLTR